MRLLFLFDLGFWLCSRWILHAVLLQPLLLLHEGGRILSKFVAHSRILRQERFQWLVVLQVIMVIGKRGIFLKILPDLLMLIEKVIHILKFLLAKVIVYVASISIAFPNGPAITIRAICIESIPVHVPGFKLIFPAHEGGWIRAHFLPYRRMLTQKLAEILVAFQVALIVDEFGFLLKRFGNVLVTI